MMMFSCEMANGALSHFARHRAHGHRWRDHLFMFTL